MKSPYDGYTADQWPSVTSKLIEKHPLKPDFLVHVVLSSWDAILKTKIADRISIAHDVKPKPQIMGFFLHEVVAHTIQMHLPSEWRKELTANDKDVVCIANPEYSIEIKTSSNKNKIFGNRSYAQETASDKKSKSSYYLAINFEQFDETENLPRIRAYKKFCVNGYTSRRSRYGYFQGSS